MCFGSNAIGKFRTSVVNLPCQQKSENSYSNRHARECQLHAPLFAPAVLFTSLRFGTSAGNLLEGRHILRLSGWLRAVVEDRCKELIESVVSAQCLGNAYPAGNNRSDGEHD